jgi:hypothetical protein
VHEKLDPRLLNKAGIRIRESRDSAEHPESRAVAVLFDVTGSMKDVPRTAVTKLGQLMGMLIRKGYLEHPHVLFGAIGDAHSDEVPLQVGQFESDLAMDDDLTRFVLEGNGGGQKSESYELGAWFLNQYAKMDCFEKRGLKGYCFILGDERYYDTVKREQIEAVIGEKVQEDVPTAEVFEQLKQKFEVFLIRPTQGSYAGDRDVIEPWQKLLQQNILVLDDANAVCELIAGTIGLCEGKGDVDSIRADLKAVGADPKSITSATKTLAVYAKSGASVVKAAKVEGDLVATGAGAPSVDRL